MQHDSNKPFGANIPKVVDLATVRARSSHISLSEAVEQSLEEYFVNLGGMSPAPELYEKVISQVEKPLIEHVLRYVRGNQLRAAGILGINRNTLRKKISNLGIEISSLTIRKN